MTAKISSRRVFMLQAVACGSLIGVGTTAHAATKVDEDSDDAKALGYRHDTTKVDAKKYPQHKPEQKCHSCQFWQGSASDEWAGCSMFGRKQISGTGWCLAYRKVA